MIITIDGPTASGKSTTAKLLAQRFGFFYLNSGYLYRALAYLLMRDKGYSLETIGDPTEPDIQTILDTKRLEYDCESQGNPIICFDGSNITPYLKTGSQIDQASSLASAHAIVRHILLDVQRDIGKKHDLVIDGRDTGSVVFPYADFKFYLTAPLELRAQRFMNDEQRRGNKMSVEQATKQLKIRDERDMTRLIAPLKIPQGAIIIDNGLYTLEETVEILYQMIRHN